MVNAVEVINHAARLGNIEVLEELVRQEADLNVQDEKGFSPLIIACYNNKYEAVEFLLDNGANIDHQDLGGNTALMGVAFKGYLEIGGYWLTVVQR